jgi:hypothetical protein
VTLTLNDELPDTAERREELYGTSGPGGCVRIDLDTDPLAFIAETEFEVVSVEFDQRR